MRAVRISRLRWPVSLMVSQKVAFDQSHVTRALNYRHKKYPQERVASGGLRAAAPLAFIRHCACVNEGIVG